MTKGIKDSIIPDESIMSKIYFIREKKVMLDRDLAELYGVETRNLKRQVRRNEVRFPEDFMFELNDKEFENWRCQFGISNEDRMGLRYKPFAFTELCKDLHKLRRVLLSYLLFLTVKGQ